jgi:hypothetical protein
MHVTLCAAIKYDRSRAANGDASNLAQGVALNARKHPPGFAEQAAAGYGRRPVTL